MKSLLLGTRNPARVRMLCAALARLSLRVVTLDELGITYEVIEDGCSTRENAEKKARAYFERAGIPTLGLDGGLSIPAFPPEKQPGVCVRRIHADGAPATDEEMLAYYTREISAIGGRAPATWEGSLALAAAPERLLTRTFTFETWLTSQPRGQAAPGMALDPLMIDPPSGKYYTQLADEERPYYHHLVDFVAEHIQEL